MLIWLGRPEGILTSSAAAACGTGSKSEPGDRVYAVPPFKFQIRWLTLPPNRIRKRFAQALTERFILGSYRKPHYKRDASEPTNLEEILYYIEDDLDAGFEAGWTKGMSLGAAIGEATCLARDLTNLPGNMLLPEDLAQKALQLAKQYGFEAQVLDEDAIDEKGMGGLLAVGKATSIHHA